MLRLVKEIPMLEAYDIHVHCLLEVRYASYAYWLTSLQWFEL
jgi:hypothetical protein